MLLAFGMVDLMRMQRVFVGVYGENYRMSCGSRAFREATDAAKQVYNFHVSTITSLVLSSPLVVLFMAPPPRGPVCARQGFP
jgi:hypothetical protein